MLGASPRHAAYQWVLRGLCSLKANLPMAHLPMAHLARDERRDQRTPRILLPHNRWQCPHTPTSRTSTDHPRHRPPGPSHGDTATS